MYGTRLRQRAPKWLALRERSSSSLRTRSGATPSATCCTRCAPRAACARQRLAARDTCKSTACGATRSSGACAGPGKVRRRQVGRHQRRAAAAVGRPGAARQGGAAAGLAVARALCCLEGHQVAHPWPPLAAVPLELVARRARRAASTAERPSCSQHSNALLECRHGAALQAAMLPSATQAAAHDACAYRAAVGKSVWPTGPQATRAD